MMEDRQDSNFKISQTSLKRGTLNYFINKKENGSELYLKDIQVYNFKLLKITNRIVSMKQYTEIN